MATDAFVWPQNTIEAPIPFANAQEDPHLVQLVREPLIYTFPLTYTANGSDQTFVKQFQVDLSNDWFLTNVGAIGYLPDPTDDLAWPVGFLTIRSNTDQYAPIDGLSLSVLNHDNRTSDPRKPDFRTILPAPWGVGAGGSFTVTLLILASLAESMDMQITLEGYRWFAFGGGSNIPGGSAG